MEKEYLDQLRIGCQLICAGRNEKGLEINHFILIIIF